MASKRLRAPGVEYRGKGWAIKLWGKGGKLDYYETVEGPYTKTAFAAAVKRREYLANRKALGLSLREGDGGSETFGEVSSRWLSSLQIDNDTIRAYWNIINRQWLPCYGSWPVNEITQADILERLAKTGLSVKSQKNLLGPLRMVLQHAGVNPNPANGIKWPKRLKKAKVQRYLPKERNKIIAALDTLASKAKTTNEEHWRGQARVYFPLLFATGLRPGEALGLLWRDYDGQFLTIEKQYTRSKAKDATKTGHDRKVYVPKWVRPTLDSHTTRFAGGPIFTGFKGDALKDTKRLNPVWEDAHNAARIALRTPYTCRHTRAAELLSCGVSPAEGAAELGHSVQMFLETYSEWIDEYAGKRDFSKLEGNTELLPNKNSRGN